MVSPLFFRQTTAFLWLDDFRRGIEPFGRKHDRLLMVEDAGHGPQKAGGQSVPPVAQQVADHPGVSVAGLLPGD
ncbi:MAG: hypothetical protein IID45_05845 [Planctomycetes bacterium]|nr:hypothetical protein [Planctomycetota bacterium]